MAIAAGATFLAVLLLPRTGAVTGDTPETAAAE
jgi:hypothetical protein